MIYKKKGNILFCILTLLLHFLHISCTSTDPSSSAATSSVPTSTDFTSSTPTSTDFTSTTPDQSTTSGFASTTSYVEEEITRTSNNVIWMVIGIVCGVIIGVGIGAVAATAYAIHNSKRVHPHSDTESFYSSQTPSEAQTRPTTASHILLEQEDEAMSRPVTMTPFELRKLYIETFPYRNWTKGYDGTLRPNMSLKFVDPRIYSKSKGDERHFREKIYNYEMSDTLTLRSSALSRMMNHTKMPTMLEIEPFPERPLPPIGHEIHTQKPPQQHHLEKVDEHSLDSF